MLGVTGRTLCWKDIRMAEDKIARHIRHIKGQEALEYLEVGNEVMDKYRPILPQDLASWRCG